MAVERIKKAQANGISPDSKKTNYVSVLLSHNSCLNKSSQMVKLLQFFEVSLLILLSP
jgi:hypothetical protein